MIRKQIYIEERQEHQLKRLVHVLGVSEAALIRQSLDRGIPLGTAGHRDPDAWRQIKTLIRRRMSKGPLSGKRTWRRDDLYAR